MIFHMTESYMANFSDKNKPLYKNYLRHLEKWNKSIDDVSLEEFINIFTGYLQRTDICWAQFTENEVLQHLRELNNKG